jgi:mannosyltransferase OCH1-like enzyme
VLRQIYGLWNTIDEMPDFMIKLKDNNAKKCFSFRSELLKKEDILKLVDVEIWEMLSNKINRRVVLADIARYYMMWKQGGFYLDMDIRVNTNLDNIVKENVNQGYTMILFTEHNKCDPLQMGIRENPKHTRRIYNCMFWSEEGNEFWKKCIDLTIKRCKQLIDEEVKLTDKDVLWASGPDIVTTIYNEEYNNYSKIKVYNAEESDKLLTHLNAGTWRSNKDN